MLVVASPLDDVDATLDRLLCDQAARHRSPSSAALAALGLWVVRLGLRPLDDDRETAAAIAAGDLSRRVERDDERTEVGRLGHALNAMLGQIESAFRAQEASERKLRRFVADASHELRTPLAAVRAYAELFGRGADERPDDLARSMRGISRESERMSLLVDDLLLLARLDEGRPLEREPVELDEVVGGGGRDGAGGRAGAADRLRAERAVVIGDRDRLRQIVDNLLAQRARAHARRARPVSVSRAARERLAVIEVADRGPGLDAGGDRARLRALLPRRPVPRSARAAAPGSGSRSSRPSPRPTAAASRRASAPDGGATFAIAIPLARGDSQETHGDLPAAAATLGRDTETEEVA